LLNPNPAQRPSASKVLAWQKAEWGRWFSVYMIHLVGLHIIQEGRLVTRAVPLLCFEFLGRSCIQFAIGHDIERLKCQQSLSLPSIWVCVLLGEYRQTKTQHFSYTRGRLLSACPQLHPGVLCPDWSSQNIIHVDNTSSLAMCMAFMRKIEIDTSETTFCVVVEPLVLQFI
jgi:hypothetical protein